METEPEKPRNEATAPSRKARLAWWFGIYLAGALILPVLLMFRSNHLEPLRLLLEFAASSLVFPCGFLGIQGFIGTLFHFPVPTHSDSNGGHLAARVVVLILLAYATYISHLVYTLKAKTIRALRYLLLALVVIVALNIGGCYEIGTDRGQKSESSQAVFQK